VTPRYVLRFVFDAGSGVCFWSANDAARSRFGYPISPSSLPLPLELVRCGEALIARYDASFDWDDPAGPGPWTQADRDHFDRRAGASLAAARRALGPEYELRDERRR
jgi:hypothetical protein